jgi:hypothetical protein
MENTEAQVQPQVQNLHPMAESIFKFVNEAITIEEAKARTQLISGVVTDLTKGIEDFEHQATATDESGNAVEIEDFTE